MGTDIHQIIAEPVMELQRPHGDVSIPTFEGPAFARDGRLLCVSVYGDAAGNKLFQVDLERREIEPIYADEDSSLTGVAVHRDGSVYMTDLGLGRGAGRVVCLAPNGEQLVTVVDSWDGAPIYPDDLVFDGEGNLYFNDMQGNIVNPSGSIFRLSVEQQLTRISGGLAAPNGLAFDGTGRGLWSSEHAANRLVRMQLDDRGELENGVLPGSAVKVYTHMSGGEVDSLTIDQDDNIYAAMYKAGRVDIFDAVGSPIGVVELAGGAEAYPNCTHVAIRPGTTEGYVLSAGPSGAMLFAFPAVAPAPQLFSHEAHRLPSAEG